MTKTTYTFLFEKPSAREIEKDKSAAYSVLMVIYRTEEDGQTEIGDIVLGNPSYLATMGYEYIENVAWNKDEVVFSHDKTKVINAEDFIDNKNEHKAIIRQTAEEELNPT